MGRGFGFSEGPFGGTLTFAAGETEKPIQISIVGDEMPEPDETFTVTLSEPVNATINPLASSATATILDDDAGKGDFSINPLELSLNDAVRSAVEKENPAVGGSLLVPPPSKLPRRLTPEKVE